MDHRYKHTDPKSVAAKIGLGMIAFDRLSGEEVAAVITEYNEVAPPEARLTKQSMSEDLLNVMYLWYYEAKVAPLKTKDLQN